MKRRDNIQSIYINDVNVYEHKLFELSDNFIRQNNIEYTEVPKHFKSMIIYISNELFIDIDSVNDIFIIQLFDKFVDLCDMYNYIPSVGIFLRMTNIKRNVLKNILNNKYYQTIQVLEDICKDRIVDYLSNNQTNSRNMIFIASSMYGMSESAPVKRPIDNTIQASNRELLDNLKAVRMIESEL